MRLGMSSRALAHLPLYLSNRGCGRVRTHVISHPESSSAEARCHGSLKSRVTKYSSSGGDLARHVEWTRSGAVGAILVHSVRVIAWPDGGVSILLRCVVAVRCHRTFGARCGSLLCAPA